MDVKMLGMLLAIAAVAGCQAPQASAAADGPRAVQPPEAPAGKSEGAKGVKEDESMNVENKVGVQDDLKSFVAAGGKLLASQTGDLDGDGRGDALLVIDHPEDGQQPSDEKRPRTVLLLVRDSNGQLQKVAQNDKVVPCSTCGGLLGDPFGYARIDKDGFTLLIEGGSRQRWSSEYVFQYSAQAKNWHLQKVERGAYDQISEQSVSKTFTSKDFGQVAFSDFDPSTIPEVVLP